MSASLRSVDGQDEATILREIQSALRDLRFGAVEITVHNAQVVQIERKEKFRLQQPGNNRAEAKIAASAVLQGLVQELRRRRSLTRSDSRS